MVNTIAIMNVCNEICINRCDAMKAMVKKCIKKHTFGLILNF